MEYNKLFILITIIGSLCGILLGIFTNDLINENEINLNLKNDTNNSFTNLTKEEKENKDKNDKYKKENTKEKENEKTDKEKEKENEKTDKEKEKKNEKTDKEKDKENEKTDKDSKKEKENEKVNKDSTKEEESEVNKEQEKQNKYKDKTIIAVSYSTDDKYIYPTIVSMTSLVMNAASNTFYNIYILHTPDFQESSKTFLSSVEKKYPNKCAVIYFNMGTKYQGLFLGKIAKLTTPAYYRLSIHELLPDVNKIIYLDGDTLIFQDLTELIKIDMKGNIFMGFLDSIPDAIKSFGFEKPTVLCSGVLLIDLESLRKYGYTKIINDFIKNNLNRLDQQDQTIINVVFQDKIAPIPPKYGMWAFNNKQDARNHNNRQWPHLKYNENELLEAYAHPAIIHFIWPKPHWKKYTILYNEWWNIARLTGFYDDIYNKSPFPFLLRYLRFFY